MHFYFVRHGETGMNRLGAYYGALDAVLTDRGRQQAGAVGAALGAVAFDAVYVSDRRRAQETVRELLLENKSAPETFCTLPGLSEMNFGCFEGLTNGQVRERFPQLYARWCEDWLDTVLDGGESFRQFFRRVEETFEAIMKDAGDGCGCGKNILICAHNGTLRVIFALMCGLGPEGVWHFNFDQDGYSLVDYECGNFTIRRINAAV